MKFTATILSLLLPLLLWSQGGYQISITFKPFKNQYIYLGHYQGKTLPIIDSVKLNAEGKGVFKGTKKLGGGIYLVGYPNRSQNFEILIDKNQQFSIVADTARIADVSFANSPENTQFKAYQRFMSRNGRSLDSLYRLRRGASAADSIRISTEIDTLNARIQRYRTDIIRKGPQSLLAMLLKAMRDPEVPQNHPAAATDSTFAYRYFKTHFWDEVQFYDDRLVRTPFFEPRLDRYFEQLVYPDPDSVIKEIDYMMAFAGAAPEMEKFLLLKFVNRYLNQKYMWEDAVMVHLYNQYFANKDYAWLTAQGKKIIQDRAFSLMANITGKAAADIELSDTAGKTTKLFAMQAPYTIVAIWDPTCGHCKEVLPKLDTAFQQRWKGIGLKMFAMAKETEGKRSDWMNFIHQYSLGDWTHVYYSKEEDLGRINSGIPSYSQLYDVQSFPTIYLLDDQKRIIGKKLTLEQIDEILSMRTKKQ